MQVISISIPFLYTTLTSFCICTRLNMELLYFGNLKRFFKSSALSLHCTHWFLNLQGLKIVCCEALDILSWIWAWSLVVMVMYNACELVKTLSHSALVRTLSILVAIFFIGLDLHEYFAPKMFVSKSPTLLTKLLSSWMLFHEILLLPFFSLINLTQLKSLIIYNGIVHILASWVSLS